MKTLRLVLDTQVWLDWLVFDDPGVRPIRNAVSRKQAEVFIAADCEAELARVLDYDLGKHRLDAAAQAACLAQCRRLANRFVTTLAEGARAGLPRCTDPDDQKFLEAALAANADLLITRDRALLQLARRCPSAFRILTPQAFSELWEGRD